ncbi:hypothetical protein [Chitinophaga sp. 212800010-3]|uniref:hypothetical protein n=1 Tax=unclassified Chitinophaga TaxID=2619133 RepID=UPI002DF5728C|nr:hypothetical protein [Chitinophaga sp. 212800010-3]
MNRTPSKPPVTRRPIFRVIPTTTWERGNMLFDYWQKFKHRNIPAILTDIDDKQFHFLQQLPQTERLLFFQTAYDLAEKRAIDCKLSSNLDTVYIETLASSNNYELKVRIWFLDQNMEPKHDYRLRVTVWACKMFHDLLDLHFKLTSLYHLYRSRPSYIELVRSGFIKDDYGRFGDLL